MALTMRAASTKAVSARRVQTRAVVRPQAALQQQKAVAGAIATIAIAAAAAAPVSRQRQDHDNLNAYWAMLGAAVGLCAAEEAAEIQFRGSPSNCGPGTATCSATDSSGQQHPPLS